MRHSRREFIRDAAIAGVVISAGTAVDSGDAVSTHTHSPDDSVRCPYFDQPMYCNGLSKDGKPLCDQ